MKSEAISHRVPYFMLSLVVVNIMWVAWHCQAASINKDAATPTRTYLWHQATAAAAWAPRSGHTALVAQNKLWLLGGTYNHYDGLNDVWSTVDGVNWTQVTSSAPWPPRMSQAAVLFEDKLWVLAGFDGSGHNYNDVWYSLDGNAWNAPTTLSPWPTRHTPCAESFRTNIYLMGGDASTLNDVWCSSDGSTWVLILEHAPWISRWFHRTNVFLDRLWLLGGSHYDLSSRQSTFLNDVWSTTDGSNWVEETAHAPWHGRSIFATAVFDNQLWVLSGSYIAGTGQEEHTEFLNDIWSSTDGANWVQAPAPAWSPREAHAAVKFHNRLWVLGGFAKVYNQDPFFANDVWYMEPDPGAMLSGSPLSGAEPLTVQFTDASTATSAPISSWHWDFGDGTSSEDQNPTHTYSNRGVYTVSLTVTAGSFYNTDTEEAYITVTGEQHPFHTADQNHDNMISLPELLRVIQFYNSDGFHCQSGTEDGYAPGPSDKGLLPLLTKESSDKGLPPLVSKPDLSRRSPAKADTVLDKGLPPLVRTWEGEALLSRQIDQPLVSKADLSRRSPAKADTVPDKGLLPLVRTWEGEALLSRQIAQPLVSKLDGDTSCASHSSDYAPHDWAIGLSELLRLIQFYNSGGYHPCSGGEDGFCVDRTD